MRRPPLAWRLIGAAGATREALEAAFGADFELVSERVRPGPPPAAVSHFVRR